MEIISGIFEKQALYFSQIDPGYRERSIFAHVSTTFPIQGLIGMRGTGKTQYMLSRAKSTPQSVYFSCDDIAIKHLTILEIVRSLHTYHDIIHFFIDEIHYSPEWYLSLKNIFDQYGNTIKIIFSGSSMISLTSGSADLSRRVQIINVPVFSFRERLSFHHGIHIPVFSLQEIFVDHTVVAKQYGNLFSGDLLKKYWMSGEFGHGYAHILSLGEYQLGLQNIIKKILYEDLIAQLEKRDGSLQTLYSIFILMGGGSTTSETNPHQIAKKLGISPTTVHRYLNYLEEIGLLVSIGSTGRLSDRVRKSKKRYCTSTNIVGLFGHDIGTLRETFFLNNLLHALPQYPFGQIEYQSDTDFIIATPQKTYLCEVGGNNKQRSDDVFVIKDDIVIGTGKTIPLRLFGFLK